MSWELLAVAVMTGLANWVFRVLPTRARTDRLVPGGRVERFLAATGPAAIATLFVASILPALSTDIQAMAPVLIGTLAVVGVFFPTRSVVLATLAGAVAHSAVFWLMT